MRLRRWWTRCSCGRRSCSRRMPRRSPVPHRNPMLYRTGGFGLVLLTAAVLAAAQTAKLPDTPIDVAKLTAHVKEISSDAYEGREPGTRAEPKVVDYLTKQLAAAGVQPGGEPDGRGGRKWTQAVTLVRSEATGPMTASVAVS